MSTELHNLIKGSLDKREDQRAHKDDPIYYCYMDEIVPGQIAYPPSKHNVVVVIGHDSISPKTVYYSQYISVLHGWFFINTEMAVRGLYRWKEEKF